MADILFLTQRIPYPPIKGEKIRALQILKHLRRSFDVHLGCLVDDPHDWEHVDAVRALCRDAYFARLDKRSAPLRYLRGLAGGQALSVATFRDEGLARWIDAKLRDVRPEAIFVCSSNMAPYMLDHSREGCVRLVDLVDVDSEKWRKYAEVAKAPMRWVYRREARLIGRLETRIAEETDFSTFVSEPEAALFRSLVPHCASKIHGVTSGVDYGYFDPALGYPAPYDPALPTFVFTGTMDYAPNVDAVMWFVGEILPLIRKRVANAQFHIVGSSPSNAVHALSRVDGVHVSGRVPDVRPYLAHASAAVAPMRIAQGIQNKVLEGMAMAKPVILTQDALEGIEAEPGREVLLAADAATIADLACRVVAGSEFGAVGAAARRRIVEHYDWTSRLNDFDRLLGEAEDRAGAAAGGFSADGTARQLAANYG